MTKVAVRNSIEFNDKKYPMMTDLFENITLDSTIISDKHKIINMKKLMRKYIDDVDKRNKVEDNALPTNATHIWYEEAKKYRKLYVACHDNYKLQNENEELKKQIEKLQKKENDKLMTIRNILKISIPKIFIPKIIKTEIIEPKQSFICKLKKAFN